MDTLSVKYQINTNEVTDYILELEFGDQTQNVDATKTLRNFNFVIACNIWLFIHDDQDEDNEYNMVLPLKTDEKDIASTHLKQSHHRYKTRKYKIVNNAIIKSISRIPKALRIGGKTCIEQTSHSIACILVGTVLLIVTNFECLNGQITENITNPSVKKAAGSAIIIPLYACVSLVGATLGGTVAVAAVPIQTVGTAGLYIYNGTNTNDVINWYSMIDILKSRTRFQHIVEHTSFKQEHSFEQRKKESLRCRIKYPERIPVICERAANCNLDNYTVIKKKYLVPYDLTAGQFLYVIRKKLQLQSYKAIFCFVNGSILPSTAETISQLYDQYKDEDGFLYMTYQGENYYG